ncbi:MAG TPA: hypothetical protein VGX25_06315 [Actinophytocola sp.]|uniref:hypothetical protein n=1 Tax=Actinophytocola sp. TaxID=1872138 RepID=UPI002DDD42C5|nr:hypothetical protein [Actinophytocola sp.]HEV2779000.1 hypothetical protein [Actinophytocola sp.]
MAVDLEGFSKLGVLDQRMAQTRLGQVLERAATGAGLSRAGWYRQPRGDGELAILPGDTDVALVVAQFPHLLEQALRELRSDSVRHPRLRLRVAMHYEPLSAGEFGPVGSAPIVACRLLDARATKAALAADPAHDLVLVISEKLYDEVVTTRFHGLEPRRFRRMRATIKGVTYRGYLCLGTPKWVMAAREDLAHPALQ